MPLQIAAMTIDCNDAITVARFWSAALNRPIDPDASSEFASIGRTEHRDTTGWSVSADEVTWLFAKVPEPKSAKNRLHIDFAASGHEEEVARLVGLGATRVTDMNEWGHRWTVLQDPEGNEFCVAEPATSSVPS